MPAWADAIDSLAGESGSAGACTTQGQRSPIPWSPTAPTAHGRWPSAWASCWPAEPGALTRGLMGTDHLERRRDVPQRQARLGVAAGALPLGQRDVAVRERLVGHLAEQVADDVEPAALLVVGDGEVPGRPRGVGGGEHRVPGPGVVVPAAVGLQVHVRQLPDLPR